MADEVSADTEPGRVSDAPGRTPVAQRGAPTADRRKGEIADAEDKADAKAGEDAEAGADAEARSRTRGGADEGAKDEAPKDRGAKDEAPKDEGPGGAAVADAGPGVDGDGDGKDVEDKADARSGPVADTATRVLKPLVSDLPERPQGASGSRTAGPRAHVAFGAPGKPVEARTPSAAPPKPVSAPLPPAALPAPSVPPAKPSGAPGTSVAPQAPQAPEGERIGPEGTRDMPVPPGPEPVRETRDPLKLLAELTNTPPPPQTLLRSVGRRFKIWTPLVVLLAIVFVVVQALRPLPSPALKLTAAPTYTFGGAPLPASMPWPSEGQSVVEVEGLGSLGVHGAQTPVPIASVTKVMTAYVILRDHPLSGKANGPVITVDATAANESGSTDESTAHVKAGQRFTERQMLQLLLIPSGNNIARLLARWDSGTQEAFVAKMRKEAAALGMTHTTYTGASGFEETTVSTAVDQLELAREVMKNDVFRSVVAMPNITIPGVGTIYNNNNDLVHLGVVGVKTGSSTPAGGALMWAAHKTVAGKEQLVLGVVLQQRGGRTTPYDMLALALANSQKLIDAVQGGLTQATIVKKGEVVGYVDDGLGGHTPVVAGKDLVAIGWPGMKAALSLSAAADGIPHSAKAGTQVGTVSFGSGSARTSVPVDLQNGLNQPSFGKKLTRLG